MKKVNRKIDGTCRIQIGGVTYKNITIVDSDDTPVVIITEQEIINRDGYRVLFDIGEED